MGFAPTSESIRNDSISFRPLPALALIGTMSLHLAIPLRVALPQSLPPLH